MKRDRDIGRKAVLSFTITPALNFAKNCAPMEREIKRRLTMQQFVLQYVQVALGQEWPSFFFLFGGNKFTHAQYIKIMYALDLSPQKFDT